MLAVHFLNVGHGDSIVIEHRDDGKSGFAVIDSNVTSQDDAPRALARLRELGAEELDFVALTHPHADHYSGLLTVLEKYRGHIAAFFSFPIEAHIHASFKKLLKAYCSVLERTDSDSIGRNIEEFVTLLGEAKKHIPIWLAPTGMENRLPTGLPGVELFAVLPPARVKGDFFQSLESGSFQPEQPKHNELSMAFKLHYRGRTILLGGDGTRAQWLFQHRMLGRASHLIASNAVKLPHHGSRIDCSANVIDMLFDRSAMAMDPIAIISANGHSHPHAEVLANLHERNIGPYCTNLARQCGAALREQIDQRGVDPVLGRYINSMAMPEMGRAVQPCQGDITLTVDDAGRVTMTTQYQHPCPYRDGYGKLLLLDR